MSEDAVRVRHDALRAKRVACTCTGAGHSWASPSPFSCRLTPRVSILTLKPCQPRSVAAVCPWVGQ